MLGDAFTAIDERVVVDLDEAGRDAAKLARARRLHVVQIPTLRALGLSAIGLLVFLHLHWVPESGLPSALTLYGSVAGAYIALSWSLLLLLWRPKRRLDLGVLFLGLDLLVIALAIRCTGGERSWLFLLPLLRVADQAHSGGRRVLLFAVLAPATYAALLLWLVLVEQRSIAWAPEAVKLAVLASASLHVSLSASTAEALRRRSLSAIAVARDLIRELQGKQRELEAAARKAQEADRGKSAFLASMSHEVRTPLAGILGMTELALGTDLDPEQRDLLSAAHTSGQGLLRVLDDILDFGRLEAGRLELQQAPFSLAALLSETLAPLAVRAHQQGLELRCHVGADVPDALHGDPGRLRQVLLNLLGNALRFTPRGSLSLAVERLPAPQSDAPGDSAWLRFTVEDTGAGISGPRLRQIRALLAEAGTRTDGSLDGVGLGLSLTAQLVLLLGGRIALDSRIGRGSTFSFEAPFAVRSETRVVPAADLRGTSVLVAETGLGTRRQLASLLRGWGAEVVEVEDGSEALGALEERTSHGRRFHALLLDARLPGLERLHEGLAAHFRDEQATVVRLVRPGDRDGPAELPPGAPALAKPVLPAELLAALGAGAGAPRAASAPRRLHASQPLRVLLVEDNPVNRTAVHRLLTSWGHTVWVAENGQVGLAAVARQSFDVVLMDLSMPVLDGLSATAAIRAREAREGGHLPIVAMTAHALSGDRERCLAAGMDGYLRKPFAPAELFDLLEALPAAAPAL